MKGREAETRSGRRKRADPMSLRNFSLLQEYLSHEGKDKGDVFPSGLSCNTYCTASTQYVTVSIEKSSHVFVARDDFPIQNHESRRSVPIPAKTSLFSTIYY